jgi:hypothetical protein
MRLIMLLNTLSTFSIPLCIYSVMGIIVARIQLAAFDRKQFNWMKWLQFAVDFLRIVFMWPLVLFIEKSKSWLENTSGLEETQPITGALNENTK